MTSLVIEADWPAASHVRACVSLRGGGVSSGPYSSLNLATHVGDRPDAVARNRSRLGAALELPSEPRWLEQVHGTRVVDLDEPWSGAADASVTRRPGVVAVVLTADCLPVLFADRRGRRVAAAHAGWRGLAGGVLENTLAALHSDPEDLLAWLGPAIGAAAYEVGDEVRAAFVATHASHADAFERNPRGRWQADLYALARFELQALGVKEIHGGQWCTRTESERFFSHRREAPCGRMATLVWLDA